MLFYIIIIVLIILLFISYSNKSSTLDKLINGFYEADTSFCEESGLDMFCLYLDEDTDFWGNRACYILAKQDGEILINEPTVANIKCNSWFFDLDISTPKYFNISFKELSEECQESFPKHQQIRFYPTIGKIVLFYNDIITAVLYKNPVNTELKSILKEKRGKKEKLEDEETL